MTSSLYNVSREYQIMFSVLADKDEWSEGDMLAMYAAANTMEDKAIAVAAYIKNLEAEAEMVAKAKDEMLARQKSLERKAARLAEYLVINLQACDMHTITKSPLFRIRLKQNPPAVTVVDETLIPKDYFKYKEVSTLDKTLIKSDIERGIEVPGAMITTKTRLEIK